MTPGKYNAQAQYRSGTIPVLRFYDPWIPAWMTLLLFSAAVVVALGAIGFAGNTPSPTARIQAYVLCAVACIGACGFAWLGRMAHFDVITNAESISCRASGDRWSSLRTGSMPLRNVRSIHERPDGQVLEVRGAAGELLQIPTRVKEYKRLHKLLTKMVRVHGA
jgi:hypothetical protein